MRILQDVVQQPGKGVAFNVLKGQVFRLTQVEGGQVADLIAYNLHDFKERYSSTLTAAISQSFRKVKDLYTIHARSRVILKVVEDTVGVHWLHGGKCCALTYALRYNVQGYRGCQDVLAETVAPYGLTPDDVGDVFNVFMNVIHYEDGSRKIEPSLAKKDDHIDLQAEMDALVVVSVCPDYKGATNNFNPTPLRFQLIEN
jgi:uncharacterized protein